jgi:zinc protease
MKIVVNKQIDHDLSIIEADTDLVIVKLTAKLYKPYNEKKAALLSIFDDAVMAGTKNHTRESLTKAIEKIGAKISIETRGTDITYNLHAHQTNYIKALSLFKEIIINATFPQKEFARIIRTVSAELEEYKENAQFMAHDQLINECYTNTDPRHKFLPEVIINELKKVKIKDVSTLHEEVMSSVWQITICGNAENNLKVKKVLTNIKRPKSINANWIFPNKQNSKKLISRSIPSKQNIEISIGSNLPLTLTDNDYPAFAFGLAVLSLWGGFAGRLMSTIREKEGLTYSIYGKNENQTATETGNWRIMTFFSPKDTEQGIKSIKRELTQIVEKGITDDEHKRFKTILQTRENLINDSLVKKTNQIHSIHLLGLSLQDYENLCKKMQTITKDEINLAVKKYLDPENFVCSIAGPTSNVKEKLTKIIC